MKAGGNLMIGTALAVLLVIAAVAQDSTPQSMKLQGYLSDKSGGTPQPANGTYRMRFDLYASDLSGPLMATSGELSVPVSNGLYEVELPFAAADFGEPARFIEITVDRDGAGPDPAETLFPRVKIVSAPFAYVAERLDGMYSEDFSEAIHGHAGDDIDSGMVAEEFVDAGIARDAEVLGTVLAGDGSGSGLDADLLDGHDSTEFLLTGADSWSNTDAYFCGADWNGNGTPGEAADVISCIQGALDEITTNEDGLDNAVTVRLPDGHFDVSSACSAGSCFELKSGIHIEGQMPRLRYIDSAPDLNMIPNGGTWLDPGPGNTLFTGQHLRGVVLKRFGVMNFGKIASFGGDGENGIAFSTIRDVYGIGTNMLVNPRSTTAWEFYNIQHVRMDHVKVYRVERGLHIICQQSTWQPANSVISDFYVYTYPNPPGGIKLEVLDPSVGNPRMMNFITFIRPQVNAFGSDAGPGSTGIWLKGGDDGSSPVQYMSFIEADVEGQYEVAVRLEQANHNDVQIAAVTVPTTGVSLDAGSQFNMITSRDDRLTLAVASQNRNAFFGYFDATDETLMRGLFFDRLDNRWSVSLGSAGRVSSGSGHFWYDDANDRWLTREGVPGAMDDGNPVVTGTGASAAQGPALWVDANTSCASACSNAGMAGCVDGWAGGTAVGCATSAERRICACR